MYQELGVWSWLLLKVTAVRNRSRERCGHCHRGWQGRCPVCTYLSRGLLCQQSQCLSILLEGLTQCLSFPVGLPSLRPQLFPRGSLLNSLNIRFPFYELVLGNLFINLPVVSQGLSHVSLCSLEGFISPLRSQHQEHFISE